MSTATVKGHYTREEADIRELVETIDKAHHNKDAAAIVARYALDAVVCDLAPPLSHRGMDLQAKQAWLNTWDGPVARESRDFNITVSGDFAFCHGFYQLGGTPKAAGKPISFWMRATVCMHRDGGAWRIVHEHTSVPFYRLRKQMFSDRCGPERRADAYEIWSVFRDDSMGSHPFFAKSAKNKDGSTLVLVVSARSKLGLGHAPHRLPDVQRLGRLKVLVDPSS
jgi:ketosteroid isomerase-like protein